MTIPAAPKTSAPAVAIVDLEHDLVGLIVADTPERLWIDIQQAIRRRRAAPAAAPPRRGGPPDFASAMRCVEREVYDLP